MILIEADSGRKVINRRGLQYNQWKEWREMYIMNKGLVDLDELILSCRDEVAKNYISEAIDCYKTGAYRAAIVAAWVAVIYDFIHKLRELELTGDKRAVQRLS